MMATKLTFFILLSVTSGCASLKISHDLNEKLPGTGADYIISSPVEVTLLKKERDLLHTKTMALPADKTKEEKEAILEYGIFSDLSFTSREPKLKNTIRVEIEILNTWFVENCYMGGCFFWPNLQTNSYQIDFRVFDKRNVKVFETNESISGELWGNVFKLYYGYKPLRELDDKAPNLLVKRSLAKFQTSDAFKRLIEDEKHQSE